ncbi:hypothetical protein B23_3029 [Geobacillus thermoleovorans B23]|nr:hypothetical protein B23_3029 [Geobacillus thermoleovorans B23]
MYVSPLILEDVPYTFIILLFQTNEISLFTISQYIQKTMAKW